MTLVSCVFQELPPYCSRPVGRSPAVPRAPVTPELTRKAEAGQWGLVASRHLACPGRCLWAAHRAWEEAVARLVLVPVTSGVKASSDTGGSTLGQRWRLGISLVGPRRAPPPVSEGLPSLLGPLHLHCSGGLA